MVQGRPRQFDQEEVLGRAAELFRDHGYAATSLAALSKAMGMGEQSIYNAFGSKEAVYLKALRRWVERSATEEPGALLRGPLRGLARIRAFFDGMVALASRRGMPKVCLFMTAAVENTAADRKVSKITSNGLLGVREVFRSALGEGLADGTVRTDLDPDHLASLLLSTTYGIQVMARAKAPVHTITEAIDTTLALIAADG